METSSTIEIELPSGEVQRITLEPEAIQILESEANIRGLDLKAMLLEVLKSYSRNRRHQFAVEDLIREAMSIDLDNATE